MEYAALFKGINVGGKNLVKMADLKRLFAELNYENVHTYIQSGNVVFNADMDENAIVEQLRKAFSKSFGFDCAVMLRTKDDIKGIITGFPFSESEIKCAVSANTAVEHLYVYLLDDSSEQKTVQRICSAYKGEDMLRVGKRELYLLCYQSIRESKLAASLAKMRVPMTARNWKTMLKLNDL